MCLTCIIEKKIMLTKDDCSKPHITIKFHDLQEGNIKKVVGEIVSHHERD
jgi:hypothetical protein